MKLIIRNQANIANKFIRFAKWKIRKLNRKFGTLIYSEIYIKKIAHKPEMYNAIIKMGLPGPDIIVSAKAENLHELWTKLFGKVKRQLRNHSYRRNTNFIHS